MESTTQAKPVNLNFAWDEWTYEGLDQDDRYECLADFLEGDYRKNWEDAQANQVEALLSGTLTCPAMAELFWRWDAAKAKRLRKEVRVSKLSAMVDPSGASGDKID